jgi:hypothetical protein
MSAALITTVLTSPAAQMALLDIAHMAVTAYQEHADAAHPPTDDQLQAQLDALQKRLDAFAAVLKAQPQPAGIAPLTP